MKADEVVSLVGSPVLGRTEEGYSCKARNLMFLEEPCDLHKLTQLCRLLDSEPQNAACLLDALKAMIPFSSLNSIRAAARQGQGAKLQISRNANDF